MEKKSIMGGIMQSNTLSTTEEIEIHIRTYRSLLKASGKIKIEKLIDSHIGMKSLLHEKGGEKEIDIASFIYVLLRLPSYMSSVKKIILGQSYSVFKNNGLRHLANWKEVEAPGRRRKMFYNGKDTLAVYIASVTDVDDIITLLTAFQIEWNKFHRALSGVKNLEEKVDKILSKDDLFRVKNIWGKDYYGFLKAIKYRRVDFTVHLLSGSYIEYAKATQQWWHHIDKKLHFLRLQNKPIYFISSNTHSITNLLTRFAANEENKLIDYLYKTKNKTLIRLWKEIKSGDFLANKENFLYYIAKKYAKTHPGFLKKRETIERKLGIRAIKASHYLDIDTQVIEVSKLTESTFVKKLHPNAKQLVKSQSIIINIDYPLGWAAYQVLIEIGQNVENIRGVYIMGKAATLNGQIGDLMIPTSIFDQHTKNTYIFDNAFSAKDFKSIFKTGLVLDNQKTICTKGTFLQNRNLIRNWYKEGYTTIEMESGPYLNAVYEFVFYNRYVENQFINLVNTPFEVGIAHYASDTPYSKAKNLGVRNLSYEGVEPTYAISLAILKKIVERELKKLNLTQFLLLPISKYFNFCHYFIGKLLDLFFKTLFFIFIYLFGFKLTL